MTLTRRALLIAAATFSAGIRALPPRLRPGSYGAGAYGSGPFGGKR